MREKGEVAVSQRPVLVALTAWEPYVEGVQAKALPEPVIVIGEAPRISNPVQDTEPEQETDVVATLWSAPVPAPYKSWLEEKVAAPVPPLLTPRAVAKLTVPVAVRPATERLPLKRPLPWTDRSCEGEVVLMPTLRLFFKMVNATLLEKSVEDATLKDLSVELYPTDHALLSEANWKFASPVPELSPTVVRPVLLTLKSVVVAVGVEDAIAKSVDKLPVAPLGVAIESRAYGEVVPTPIFAVLLL